MASPTPPPVRLGVVKATREPAHVVITVEAWWLPQALQWYWQPQTVSRVGEPTNGSWRSLAAMLRDYAAELDGMVDSRVRDHTRRVKARRRRFRR